MSVSIGSMNYSMLDEIWDNYKYPKKEMRDTAPHRSEHDYHQQSPPTKASAPVQVHIEQFKPIHPSTTAPGQDVSSMDMGSYAPVVDHPANSNHSTTNTYNDVPYNKNEVYTPLLTHANNRMNNNVCMGSIDHLKHCRYCYEHMKKELHLSSVKEEKSILDFLPKVDTNTVILVLGGIAAGMILSDLFLRRRRRR